MNAIYARRLWLMFRFDFLNGLCLIGFMIAAFWGMGIVAEFCRVKGWCS